MKYLLVVVICLIALLGMTAPAHAQAAASASASAGGGGVVQQAVVPQVLVAQPQVQLLAAGGYGGCGGGGVVQQALVGGGYGSSANLLIGARVGHRGGHRIGGVRHRGGSTVRQRQIIRTR